MTEEIVLKKCYDGWTQSGKNDRECYRVQKSDVLKYPIGTVAYVDHILKDGYKVTIIPDGYRS